MKVYSYPDNKLKTAILIKNNFSFKYNLAVLYKNIDVGDKLGFLEATIEFALKREELREGFIEYLNTKPWERV